MHIQPVFVDASGRRRRTVRRAGLAAGVALVVFLVLLVVGAATGSGVPLTPWSSPQNNHPQHPVVPGGAPVPVPKGSGTAGGSSVPSTGPVHAPVSGSTTNVPRGQNPASHGPTSPTTTSSTSPAAVTTSRGKSQADPPAVGKTNKPSAP